MWSRRHKSSLFVDGLIGALVCGVGALLLVLLFRGSPMRPMVPLLFIAVIVFAAMRFGMLASAIGSLTATLVFAYFLFTPIGSFRVQKGEARTNLAWMLLIGVPAGYFAWSTKVDKASKD